MNFVTGVSGQVLDMTHHQIFNLHQNLTCRESLLLAYSCPHAASIKAPNCCLRVAENGMLEYWILPDNHEFSEE